MAKQTQPKAEVQEKKEYQYDENVLMFIFWKTDEQGKERITVGKWDEDGTFRFAHKDGLPVRAYRVNSNGLVIKKQVVADVPVYDLE